MIVIKNEVLLTWELICQLELSSHASKTAVFNIKKTRFSAACLFHGFSILNLFVVFVLSLLNLFDTGVICATKAPKKKSR